MPTDLDAAEAARKHEAKAETQTLITLMLVGVIISLGVLMLLFEVLRQYS